MTHPLTDEIIEEIAEDVFYYEYSIPIFRQDMRAAYDKGRDDQLEQVIAWLKLNTDDYLLQDYYKTYFLTEAFLDDFKKAMRPLICEDCGKQDETVRNDNCPYAEEVCGVIQPVVICPDCYHQRCMDI